MVLQAIGFDLISTHASGIECDESWLLVVYNPKAVLIGPSVVLHNGIGPTRRGMRIPLDFMEECVSLWPYNPQQNNFWRLAFTNGMEAARDIRITCQSHKKHALVYGLNDQAAPVGRITNVTFFGFIVSMFPVITRNIEENIASIITKYTKWAESQDYNYLAYLETDALCLAEVQSFVMGFYYAMLKPLLDTSQLIVQEAYGDWQWNDLNLLYRISKIVETKLPSSDRSKTQETAKTMRHEAIIQLLAIFFAGADETQCAAINEVVIGLHGKISIVPASLLGDADEPTKAMKFYLLDLDSTAIPSNAKGMIFSADDQKLMNTVAAPAEEKLCDIRQVNPQSLDQDFTHTLSRIGIMMSRHAVLRIDTKDACIVRRFSPRQIQLPIWPSFGPQPANKPSGKTHHNSTIPKLPAAAEDHYHKVYLEGIECLFDKKYARPDADNPSILFAVRGCNKARTCLQVIYRSLDYYRVEDLNPWPSVKWMHPSYRPVILHYCNPRAIHDGRSLGAVIIA